MWEWCNCKWGFLCFYASLSLLRSMVEYARSGSSVSTEYGSWQIVSGCGSIHDAPPLPLESPLPYNFQDEGPSGRMWVSHASSVLPHPPFDHSFPLPFSCFFFFLSFFPPLSFGLEVQGWASERAAATSDLVYVVMGDFGFFSSGSSALGVKSSCLWSLTLHNCEDWSHYPNNWPLEWGNEDGLKGDTKIGFSQSLVYFFRVPTQLHFLLSQAGKLNASPTGHVECANNVQASLHNRLQDVERFQLC